MRSKCLSQSGSVQARWCRLWVSYLADAVDHQIRSDLRAHRPPAHFTADLPRCYSLMQQAARLSVVVRPKSGHRDGPTRSDHRARCEPAPCANWSALSLDQPSPPGAVPSPAAWRGGRPHPRRLRTTERASGRPTPPRGTPSNCPPTTRCVASIVSGSGQTVAMAGQPAARSRYSPGSANSWPIPAWSLTWPGACHGYAVGIGMSAVVWPKCGQRGPMTGPAWTAACQTQC